MKMEKTTKFILIFFLVFGLVFLIIGVSFGFEDREFKNDAIETQAKVISSISGHGTSFEFIANRTEYTVFKPGLYNSTWTPGKIVTIYYDPRDPNNISVGSDALFIGIFAGMGLMFMLIGLIPALVSYKTNLNNQKLITSGRRITAQIEKVVEGKLAYGGKSLRHNIKYNYHVICSWQNNSDGKTYLFKSPSMWINPSGEIAKRNIENLPVYINDDYSKYYVDISSLTENVVNLT